MTPHLGKTGGGISAQFVITLRMEGFDLDQLQIAGQAIHHLLELI
jgi:hypothetical protein